MSAIPSLRRSVEIGVGAAMGAEEEARRLQASIHAREVSLKVFDPFEEGELMALLPILKDLKKVKTIALEATDRNTACRIPLRALSLAVNRTAKLEDFFLAQLTFEGSIEDMETFAETLKRRQTLREFFLVECQLPRPARASSLEPVARGLAGLPHVRVVYLHAREMDGLGSLSTEAVSALCESQTIKELKLYHFDLPDDQVMTVARHLESNQVIEELGLSSCNLNSVMTTAAICKMLRQNSALHSLELVPKAIIQDNYSMLIAEALEGNVSLKSFSLGGNFSVSQACKDAFEQALEENYQLVSFRLMSLLGSDLPEHQMYLRLNQAGRAHLPKANRNEWINVLHRASDSLDCIYYILSINPYLCHTTKETQSQVRTQWRGNKKRRLNDDQDIATPQNSTSVNSSLSSSENSSSPTQSEQSNEERNTSTNSDNVAQHVARQITYASTSSANRNGKFSESDPATGASGLGANRNQDSSGNSNNAVSRRQLVESVISRLLGGSSQASSIDLTSSLIPNALTVLQQQQQVGQLQQPLQQHQPQQLRHLQQPIIQQLQQQQQQGAGQSSNPRGQSGDDLLTTSVPLLLSQLLQLQRGRQVAMNPAASSEQQIQQGQPQYHGQQLHRPGGAQIAASASQEAAERSSGQSAFPLYMPRDKECLSSYQCLLRQQIELFAAGSEDVKSTMPGRNKAIVLGQVGIRCRHCAMLPARHRGTGATYYPAKLDRLYQAAQNMAQTHFSKHCRHIPQGIVNELSRLLQGSKSSAGAGKKYWSDGARLLGVFEINDILRLDRSSASVS